MSGAPPPVAVAVVSASARDELERCLASLRADHDAGLAEVWVVDNASTDGAANMVRERHPWAQLIASQENLGFGRAVNLVAERTSSPWLVCANDDVAVRPGALARLLATGEADARVGAVAPRLILPDGSTQHSAFPFLSPAVAAAIELDLRRWAPRRAEALCLLGAWDPDRPRAVPWAIAALLLLRRSAFDAVGGFDPGQWMYAEDLSLGWRLREAGWTTRYEPAAHVDHAGGVATEAAFGFDREQRRMAATYAWMADTRGPATARATAAVGWAAHAARGAFWAPARGARAQAARERAHYWRTIHAHALRRRSGSLAP